MKRKKIIKYVDSFSASPTVIFTEPANLAQAANPNNRAQTYLDASKTDFTIKKEDYRNLVKLIRNMEKDEGVIRQFLHLQKTLNAQGMENTFKQDVQDIYKVAFNTFARRVNEGVIGESKGLDSFQRKFCYQYWTSGMVVTLERVATMNMTSKGVRTKSYKVPVELKILDPLLIDLDSITTKNEVYYDINSDIVDDVKKNGVKASFLVPYADNVKPVKATPDNPNPYQPKSKKDIVQMIIEGKTSVPLPMDKVRVFLNKDDSSSSYPIPFFASVLVALADKAMLREADRSIMSKLISMLLVYQVGALNAQGNKVNVGDKLLRAAGEAFAKNMSVSKDGKVLVTIVPDTHKLQWVNPETDSLFDKDKYMSADLQIYSSLYGPAALHLFQSGSNDGDLFLRIVRTYNEGFLSVYRRFIEEIYEDIIIWNNMRFSSSSVNFRPKRFSVWDTKEITATRGKLADKNQLSLRRLLDDVGEDIDAEVPNLIDEKKLRDTKGIFIATPTFTQKVIDSSGGERTTSSQESQGKPVGTEDGPKNE